MDIAITKMSSKGQIVIPVEMRKDIKEGEELLIIKKNGQIIMKKASDSEKNFEEDLEFARRTREAWEAYDRGEFITQDADEFLKDLEKWAKE